MPESSKVEGNENSGLPINSKAEWAIEYEQKKNEREKMICTIENSLSFSAEWIEIKTTINSYLRDIDNCIADREMIIRHSKTVSLTRNNKDIGEVARFSTKREVDDWRTEGSMLEAINKRIEDLRRMVAISERKLMIVEAIMIREIEKEINKIENQTNKR